eukprot:31434-Pelagococcus_subviridis.AAC.7
MQVRVAPPRRPVHLPGVDRVAHRVPVDLPLRPAPKLEPVDRPPAVEPVKKLSVPALVHVRLRGEHVLVPVRVLELVHRHVPHDGEEHPAREREIVRDPGDLRQEQRERPRTLRDHVPEPVEPRAKAGERRPRPSDPVARGPREPAEPAAFLDQQRGAVPVRLAVPHAENRLADVHRDQPQEELPLVPRADARADDRAVVIHPRHAPLADAAVLRPQRPRGVARLAKLPDVHEFSHRVLGCVFVPLHVALHRLLVPLQLVHHPRRPRDASHASHPLLAVVRRGRDVPGS